MKPSIGYLKPIFLLGFFVWPMLFIWQGLDFTDMGFWLTSYQQFYTAPESIPVSCWLSCFLGHWLGFVFGDTVIGYRLAFVGIVTITAFLSYRVLASLFGQSSVLAGLILLALVFVTNSYGNWVDYNNLTALFYVVGAILLYYGLTKEKTVLVFFAGVILATNLFVRFPNLLGVALIAAVWLWAWMVRWPLRKTVTLSALFLAGFAFGVALVGWLIELHGHRQFYLQVVARLMGVAASDPSFHHSGRLLLKMFVRDQALAIFFGFSTVAVGSWIAYRLRETKPYFLTIIILGSAIGLAVLSYYHSDIWIWAVTGFCYVVLLMVVFREVRRNPALALMAFIAGMVLFLAPLGSSNGIRNAVYGMYLALPLSLLMVQEGKGIFWGRSALDNSSGRILAITIILALGIQSVSTAWFHTYRDSTNRFSMTSTIDHPKLVDIYTTEPRAKVVTEVISALENYVQPGDELLAYNSIPLIHFITQTKPWLGTSWPMLLQPYELEPLIARKELESKRVPVVVRARVETRNNHWPSDSPLGMLYEYESSNRIILQSFLDRNAYKSIWSNNAFEILVAD